MKLKTIVKEIFRYLPSGRRKQILLLLVCMCLVAVVEAGALGLIGMYAAAVSDVEAFFRSNLMYKARAILGSLVPSGPKDIFLVLTIAVVLAVGIKNILNTSLQYVMSRFSAVVSGFFGDELIRGILMMPYEWHLKQNSADLVTTFYWRDTIGNVILNSLRFAADIILIGILLTSLILVNPMVSGLVICFVGGSAWAIFQKLRPRIDRKSNTIREISVSLNRQSTKIIHGIKDIKLISYTYPIMNLVKGLRLLALNQASQARLLRLPYDLLEFIGFFVFCGTILSLNFLTRSPSIQITGTATLLAVTAWRVLPAMTRILMSLSTLRGNLPMASQVMNHLILFQDEVEHGQNDLEQAKRVEFKDLIELKDISFSYDGVAEETLSKVNLTIEKGRTIGIIGPSGAGKSTLADILIGFLKPKEGKICLDRVPLNDSDRVAWMKQIGYVPQTPYISDDTLLSNIAFGHAVEAVDRDFVLKCCRMANIDDFLNQLPQGIDTPIGERGVRLSGGQRQRVAIARALYKKSDLIVLDEATSALDMKSEREIQKTLRSLHGNVTMVIIAHRLSTVEHCDRVLWLDKGKVRVFGETTNVILKYLEDTTSTNDSILFNDDSSKEKSFEQKFDK